jgi:hypothetical protein
MSDSTNSTPEDNQQAPESSGQDAATETAADSGTSGDSLASQITTAQTNLSKLSRGLRRSTTITACVGVVLIGLMYFYYSFGLKEISQLSDPQLLIGLAKDQMQVNNFPTSPADLQKWLDDQITENTPLIAEQFSQQAVEMAPSVRLTVENYAVEQMGLLVDQGTAFTADQFSDMVDDNRVTIEGALNDLAKNEKLSEATMEELIGLLEKELATDIQEQASLVLGTLQVLDAKLERLATADDLNEEEQAERAALMIARRLLVEQAGASVSQ